MRLTDIDKVTENCINISEDGIYSCRNASFLDLESAVAQTAILPPINATNGGVIIAAFSPSSTTRTGDDVIAHFGDIKVVFPKKFWDAAYNKAQVYDTSKFEGDATQKQINYAKFLSKKKGISLKGTPKTKAAYAAFISKALSMPDAIIDLDEEDNDDEETTSVDTRKASIERFRPQDKQKTTTPMVEPPERFKLMPTETIPEHSVDNSHKIKPSEDSGDYLNLPFC